MPLVQAVSIPDESKVGKVGFFVIPVFGMTPQLGSLLETVATTLPENFGIAIFDDASPNSHDLLATIGECIKASGRDIFFVSSNTNRGFVTNVNSAFKQLAGFDVIICNSDVVPAHSWFESLYRAAKSSPLVASATSQTNNGTISTVDFPDPAIDFLSDLNHFGRKLSTHGNYFPAIPTCVGHLVYFNAQALSVVGLFDEAYSPGYGEEVDWSQRAVRLGFRHVLAVGSLAFHFGSQTFDRVGVEKKIKLQIDHEKTVAERYPNYHESISVFTNSSRSQLFSSQLAAKASAGKLHLRLDFTDIGPTYTGTGRVAIEMAKRISINNLVAEVDIIIGPKEHQKFFADELGNGYKIFEFSKIEELNRADVVFRPMQVRSEYDLVKLFQMAHRQIIHQLDFIAYENSSYFDSASEWNNYRGVTNLAYALSDEITYLSEFVREQSLSLGLSSRLSDHGTVIYAGTDHSANVAKLVSHGTNSEWDGARPCKSDLLVVGATFAHKNRLFALRILNELITEHGFEGKLFLVGPNPTHGSSLSDEVAYLDSRKNLRESDELLVEMISSVGLVLYPTTSEGFGLVPFEAAAVNTACLATRAGSLGEILKSVDHRIDLASVSNSAASIKMILEDPEQSEHLLNQVKEVGSNFLWNDVVDRLYEAVEKVAVVPAPSFKDQLWDRFLLNFLSEQEKRLNAEAHRLQLIEVERQLIEVERQLIEVEQNHQNRLSTSTFYRLRHSKFGKSLIPLGSIRDQIVQLTIRKVVGVRKLIFGKF